ncbi:ABC transporter permease [Siccirubricoccus phaeus]|uniref:ABC transporter permease n=1 Tax=Siccirubricoccus phaeus TaxID=2595053 RepID=UPI001F381D5A|nr:ABC transporter permease [Siccirubricoccus phaeus]
MMVGGARRARDPREKRPWTFYALATLMGAFLLFLYGPMAVIYILSFQGPDGGVTFPMVGFSTTWFEEIWKPGQMANIPVAFWRSVALASIVCGITVVVAVAAGLGFRRRFPGSGVLFYLAVASLVMPSLLVGFGIGLGFRLFDWKPDLFTSALAAQLTWTLPFGLFAMFAVFNRFNRAYEEAATDLGASAFQRLRWVTLPILAPGIIGVAMGAFTLSYDEYARSTLVAGNRNTLPLEIYALISSSTSPTLFAIGTLTTAVSFLVIGGTLLFIRRMQRRRAGAARPA